MMPFDMAIVARRPSVCQRAAKRIFAFWSALVVVLAPRVLLADDQSLQVREERRGNDIELVATSANCAYAVISLTTELTNMRAISPLTVETAGQLRLVVATLSIVDPSQRWGYKWHVDWKPGGRGGLATKYDYALPFRGTFKLLQGPLGEVSHGKGSQDEQAYDWAMPVGTEVYAARPGVVACLRQDVSAGGPDPKFKKDFNYVVIRHDDGTFGEYAHLAAAGVRVELGAKVTADTVLGLSGNTGFSSEPHLHFVVFNTNDGTTRTTIPIAFRRP